ncbi:MAG: Sua5/YciO/YrdC/YwlC family protein [Solirubrobacteraceae bacterium]
MPAEMRCRGAWAEAFERCMASGGVAVFPSDTVYGLACDPADARAVKRLYQLKGRPPTKPSAVMFFALPDALDALPWVGGRTQEAMRRLLPGPVSLLVENPERRFALACGEDGSSLGIRVVDVPALAGVRSAVLQSSANLAGGGEPRRVEEVPDALRAGADLVIDGGPLPGTSSTVIDLRGYEQEATWTIVRQGAMREAELAQALDGRFHFRPAGYAREIRAEIPAYDALQDRLVAISGAGGAGRDVRRMLELGTGTGETALRLLARHPQAVLLGIDESAEMLAEARRALPAERVALTTARLQDELPEGPFDLVASALCIHHLQAREKADLFARVARVLGPQRGRFVFADLVVAEDPRAARISLSPGYDKPSTVAEQLAWLDAAGFEARVAWAEADLAVFLATV